MLKSEFLKISQNFRFTKPDMENILFGLFEIEIGKTYLKTSCYNWNLSKFQNFKFTKPDMENKLFEIEIQKA